jgi:putative NADPH-quinone reductase
VSRVLVVAAHPRPDSYGAAVRRRVLTGLAVAGRDVDLLDLYAEGFDPVLGAAERQRRFDPATADPVVADHVARLTGATALVFVHPTWWSGPPAIVKGWMDRVLALGAAYELVPGRDRITGRLRRVRRLAVVTTHGSPRWVNVVQGEAGRLTVLRQLRLLCHPLCRREWVALYGLDRADAAARAAFLDRVERRFSAW